MNPGDRFGRYQIIRQLGRGAMGEVYLARDSEAAREVAVKIVYKGPEPEDQDILDAERLGAEIQKRLSGADKRVVTVNRYGEIAGNLFIEMEYIEGEDLSAIMGRGPVNSGLAALVARELCEMLENLSAFTTTIGDRQFVGVIHGDLKPRNIRLNSRNQVKVLDFGISKALSNTRRYTMNVFASTAYCSPERLETQNMDAHSDLWSVGVLLYQMLAGRLPYDEPSKEKLERRIRSAEPPAPLPASCPEPLSRIVLRMLAREPARRYQSATDVKHDLARWQRGEAIADMPDAEATVRTRPPGGDGETTTRTAETAPPPVYAGDQTVRTPAGSYALKRERGRRLMSCLAVAVICSVLFLAFMMFQYHVWSTASQLRADLESERVTNLDDAWNRYQDLAKRSVLGPALWGARSALKKHLLAAADHTIDEYRSEDAPAVYISQWEQARNAMARGLELDPDDREMKGRLWLCEGHIDRITANPLHGVARQKRLNEAIQKFEEAATLLKKSPDPYLGLARIYTYDLNDMEKAEEALNKAADYGHPPGHRERAQLADGYRRRADRFWKESRGFVNAPDQERTYLEEAKQNYTKAQDLYQQAGLFGDTPHNQLQAIQAQQQVEQRLSELQGGFTAQ